MLTKNLDPSAIFRPPNFGAIMQPHASGDVPIDSHGPFPVHLLPFPLDQYIHQASASLGCDSAYVAVPMLAALASAIGNTRRIRLKPTWTEPAVIWAAVVGESGTVKSPALELALRPIWRHQRAALKAHTAARANYKMEITQWKAQNKLTRGPEPQPPTPCEHSLCLDITIEALADRLMTSPRGTLVAPDELAAWFGSFNQYKGGGADVAHWLSLFGARPLKVDRKTGEHATIYVPQAAVSITGTIQPDTLRKALTPEFFGNGLTARILLAMPTPTPKCWTDQEIDPVTDQAMNALFKALFALKSIPGIEGDSEAVMVDLAPDTLDMWIAFVNAQGHHMKSMDTHQRAAYSKLEGYAARFALIFHCITTATGHTTSDYVDALNLSNSIDLVRWFWEETIRVYDVLWQNPGQRSNDELIELIKRNGGTITVRQLSRGARRYRSSELATQALHELVEGEKGEWFYPSTPNGGGQPSLSFRLFE